MSAEPGLLEYCREAESWDRDHARESRRSARTAWWVAAAGWACAIAGSVALLCLMPLKRVEPFVVRVDNSTGVVDVVPVYAGTAAPEEAITRYFLTHYVTVCERFNFSTAESDYEECGAFHSAARNQAWYAAWATTNPLSPLNLHKDGGSVRAQVQSVSFFTRSSGLSDLAQVRYLKALRPAGGSEETFTHWIATIQYAYAKPANDPRTRRWNPLGFKILEFRSEPEVLTETGATTTAATAATSDASARNDAGRRP
jgi:type IV secretion system protein VirB8